MQAPMSPARSFGAIKILKFTTTYITIFFPSHSSSSALRKHIYNDHNTNIHPLIHPIIVIIETLLAPLNSCITDPLQLFNNHHDLNES